MKIAVDAFGGDHAPTAVIEGARSAVQEARKDTDPLSILLIGNLKQLEPHLPQKLEDNIELFDIPAREGDLFLDPLSEGENPNSAIRTALRLHRENIVQGVVSAGSTGAQVVASLLELEKCPGITRPAVGTILPTRTGPCVLIDIGASLVATPHQLVQFASLGHVYATELIGLKNPRIGLLNVAKEANLGDRAAVQAHTLLTSSGFNFIGFVEGRDIPLGVADVIVTNGMVGNVLLKFIEGIPALLVPLLPASVSDAVRQTIIKLMDFQPLGGEPLLGVKGVSIICHGASDARSISASIKKAVMIADLKLSDRIQSFLEGRFDSYISQVKYLRSFRRSLRAQWRSVKKIQDEDS